MAITNKTMLITYSDSLGKNLKELDEILTTYFGDAIGGVHLLPFFPSTGTAVLPRWIMMKWALPW